jgi:hypothetical protein
VRKTLLAALLGVAALAALAPAAFSRPSPLAVPAGAGVSAKEPGPLLGIVRRVHTNGLEWSYLAHVDPDSLRAVAGPALPIGLWGVSSWAFSPDRSRLALVRHTQARRGSSSSIRIVDVGAMRRELELPLGYAYVPVLAWLEPDRLLAVRIGPGQARLELLTIAPSARRVLSRVELDGDLMNAGQVRGALALLLSPEGSIGQGRLVVASRGGDVRSVDLERVWIGNEQPDAYAELPVAKWRRAGFTVDPDGRRAYVFPPASDAAEVDLDTLAVSYHTPTERVSLFRRLRNFFDPAAQAKALEGPTRSARWIGGGLVALSGLDYSTWKDGNGTLQMRSTPAGLTLVDTRSWTVRTVDRSASSASLADELLLATGSACESEGNRCTGIGVAAYGLDGELRYRLFEGQSPWVWTSPAFRGRAFVGMGEGEPMRLVELASGRVVGERREPLPWLLAGDASAFGE